MNIEKKLDRIERKIEKQNQRLNQVCNWNQRYQKMISIIDQFGEISPEVLTEIQGDLERNIVRVLIDSQGLNISEITQQLRERKGSASRINVSKSLEELDRRGIVEKAGIGRGKVYRLSRYAVQEMAQAMGIIS